MTGSTLRLLKAIGLVVPLISLIWGGYVYLETKNLEARRPYLDYQLLLYKRTARTVAIIVSSDVPSEVDDAKNEFYLLYWGELVLVENPEIEKKMVAFERDMQADSTKLKNSAYYLVHALRRNLAKSWGARDWEFKREDLVKP